MKVICCLTLVADSVYEKRFFTVVQDKDYKCFYEIPESEARFLRDNASIMVDTQYIRTKQFIVAAQ